MVEKMDVAIDKKIDTTVVCSLLRQSYWANSCQKDIITISISF